MDTKKISFGFSKTIKKPTLLPTNKEKVTEVAKVELIKCLEGQEIKLVEEKPIEAPLVIPLKENTKTSSAIASLIKRRAVLLGEADEPPPEAPTSNIDSDKKENTITESLEQRAAREILASVQDSDNQSVDKNLIVAAKNADELPLDGAKQSSIDDYENVPIEQFGKAMLRGMGWVEPIQKKGQPPTEELPLVRPKGMGLGADKALKKQPLLIAPEKNEVLEIKKLAYVRLLGGKSKDMYGQIEGFDDHAGRVIVKMAIGGAKEAFNEFLCQPVSKKEYAQYGKCINTTKYEEYKKMENEHGQIIIKREENIKKEYLLKDEGVVKSEYKKEEGDIRKHVKNERNTHDESRRRDEKESERHHSGSRRQNPADQPSYSSNSERDKDAMRRDNYSNKSSRYPELDEERSSYSRRERHDERRNDYEKPTSMPRDRSKRHEYEQRAQSASGSSSRRQQYSDDTSASSDTDSGSDSAYERKHKKKSSHKSKAKKKSSKKSKRKHRHRKAGGTEDDSSNSDSDEDEDSYQRRKNKQHKKKTKKSKKPRSRSRSHERNNKR